MQEPAFALLIRRRLAALAVDPGQRTPGARDEVIAPRLGTVPPARVDAFGACEQRKLPFREPARRLDQPQGAGGVFVFSFRRKTFPRKNWNPGPLRTMIFAHI